MLGEPFQPDNRLLEPFQSRSRPQLIYGPGCVARLGEVCRELGAERIAVITDRGLRAAGHADRVEAVLTDAGGRVSVYDEASENPTEDDAERCARWLRHVQPQLIVGLGGGSAMDCAKAGNFLLTNGGQMRDYWGYGRAQRPLLPMVLIPTTGGTGSEAQSYALIAHRETHQKMACGDPSAAARIAVLDPELTLSCPPAVTAQAGMDALVHAIESYVCTRANPLSRWYAAGAFRYLARGFPGVLRSPESLPHRAAMLWGAHLAGAAIEHAMLGAAHAAANPLTARFGVAHGAAVALMIPHVIDYNAVVAESEYAELLSAAGVPMEPSEPASASLRRRLEHWAQMAGLPRTLSSFGICDHDIAMLAAEAAEQWTAKFNPRPIDAAGFQTLYRAALSPS